MILHNINGEDMNWSKFFLQALIFTFILCLNSLLVMLCWNAFLIHAVNGVNEIGFITSMGLTGLAGLLFKENGIKVNFK